MSTERTRLSASARRSRLVDAAIQLLAKRGYDAVSVGDIADAAGCSKAVLYDHFPSKAQLAVAAVEETGSALMTHITEAVLTAANESKLIQLERGFDAFFEFNEHNPDACRMVFREPSPDPAVYEAHRRVHQSSCEAVAALLEAGFDGECAADHRPRLAVYAHMTTSLLVGMLWWWDEHPDVTRAEIVRLVISYTYLGLDRLSTGKQVP